MEVKYDPKLSPKYEDKPTFFECDVKNCKNEVGDELVKHIGRLPDGHDYQFCISHELSSDKLTASQWIKEVKERVNE